jgi:hypothetical protein
MNIEVMLLVTRVRVFLVNVHENEILAHVHDNAK